MRRTSVGPRSIRYRWSWSHVPDAPELIGASPVVAVGSYAATLAAFALPVVQRATGVSLSSVAAVLAGHAAWLVFAATVLLPRAKTSKRAFDAIVIGNALISTTCATAFAVLGDSPASVLWGAVILYATMNGALFDFEPSIALQVIHVSVPLATIPIFELHSHGAWGVAGPVIAALFAAVGYHQCAFNFAIARANRRAIEERLVAAERVAHELRLARDLHDVVGSTLGTVKLYADMLADQSPIATPLSSVAQDGLDDLRAVLDALAPPAGEGLESTVTAIARRLVPPGVDVAITGTWPAVDGPVRVAVARIVQEALFNAIRHGGAKQIAIAASGDPGTLRIEVRDDGRGFAVEEATAGRGLVAMRTRAQELGGALAIRSRPASGTTIAATFVLGHPRELAA